MNLGVSVVRLVESPGLKAKSKTIGLLRTTLTRTITQDELVTLKLLKSATTNSLFLHQTKQFIINIQWMRQHFKHTDANSFEKLKKANSDHLAEVVSR